MEIIALILAIIGVVVSFIGMVLSLTRPDDPKEGMVLSSTRPDDPKEKILLVDDDESNLKGLVEFLEEQFFDVRTASTVEQAEQLLTEEDFNYATIDLEMKAQNPMYKEWGGIEVFRFIKASRHNTQIIILSSHSLDELRACRQTEEEKNLIEYDRIA